MAFITTIPLFKDKTIAAGGNEITDVIDLRDISRQGNYSISYRVKCAGGVGSAGTVGFSYLASPVYAGTYVPESGTSGTSISSATGGTGLCKADFLPTPFLKIKATVGSSGTAVIDAELNVQ